MTDEKPAKPRPDVSPDFKQVHADLHDGKPRTVRRR